MGYSVTWDNPADAYRHFAWNYFNTKDMNANKARLIGDNHELALIGAKRLLITLVALMIKLDMAYYKPTMFVIKPEQVAQYLTLISITQVLWI